MRVIDSGTIFDPSSAPATRRFCSVTSPTVLADGRLLVAFRSGSSKDAADENVLIRQSQDGGRTWTTIFEGLEPILDGVAGGWRTGAISEIEPGRLIGAFCWVDRSDPRRPLANPETSGVLPSRVFILDSFDAGRTWTNARELDNAPLEATFITGAVLRLGNGDLAVPHESWKTYYDARPGEHHAFLRISHDGARTFDPPTIVAHAADRYYYDQRLSVDPDSGRPLSVFWTYDCRTDKDVNLHCSWGSVDGRTWEPPADMGFPGQIGAPLCLGGGRVLVVYVRRYGDPSLRAIMSEDLGRTWNTGDELIFYRRDADTESNSGDVWEDIYVWTFGHPEPVLLPDGDVFVAYYAGDPTAMGMHWIRLRL